jgi:hypothetical protein
MADGDLSNPPSASEQAHAMQLIQQLANTNPALRSQMAKMAQQDQRVILPVPYWSVVTFQAAPVAGVITIDTVRRAGFQYAQGQDMSVAGATGTVATYADTNIQRAGETLSNADVWIYGVCVEIEPGSEPKIIESLWKDAFLDLSTDGQNSIRLGTPAMFPSAGGLYGRGFSACVLPAINVTGQATDLGQGAEIAYIANGNPIAGSFIRFPQPFKWGAIGAGGADASLTIGVTLAKTLTLTLPVARAAAAGVAAYTRPANLGDPGTFAKLRLRLVAQSVNKRSMNA